MIVYLARAIQAFVMYCVNGTSRSSLLIESIYVLWVLCSMQVIIMNVTRMSLARNFTPHECYMILPALGISAASFTTIYWSEVTHLKKLSKLDFTLYFQF